LRFGGFHKAIEALDPSELSAPLGVCKLFPKVENLNIIFSGGFVGSDSMFAQEWLCGLTPSFLLWDEPIFSIPSQVGVNGIFQA
jgi:hypothetical protein